MILLTACSATQTAPAPEPSATPVPTAMPTPAPTVDPSLLLYEADWSQGVPDWPSAPGWHTAEGMLASTEDAGTTFAPYEPGIAGYAIEAEIQMAPPGDESGGWFSLVAHGPDLLARMFVRSDGTFGAYGLQSPNSSFFSNDIDELESIDPAAWHTYRLEVTDRGMELLLDGRSIASQGWGGPEPDDLRVGFSVSEGVRVTVRAFRVLVLND